MLVQKKSDGQVYAMKILNKKTIVERNEVEHTKAEKSILMKLSFPYLVCMKDILCLKFMSLYFISYFT